MRALVFCAPALCGALVACAPHAQVTLAPPLDASDGDARASREYDASDGDARASRELDALLRREHLRTFAAHLAASCAVREEAAQQLCGLATALARTYETSSRACGTASVPFAIAALGKHTSLERAFAAQLADALNAHPDFVATASADDERIRSDIIAQQWIDDDVGRTALPPPGNSTAVRALVLVDTQDFATSAHVRARMICLETGVTIATASTPLSTAQRIVLLAERASRTVADRARLAELYHTLAPEIAAREPMQKTEH